MTAMLPRAPTEVTRTKLQRSTEISENTTRNEPVAVARTVFRTMSDPDCHRLSRLRHGRDDADQFP